VVAVIGGAIVIHAIFFQKKNDRKHMPYTSAGMIAMIQGISGSQVPFFLLKLAQQLKCYSFCLHLPLPGGIYIIGDHNLAGEILKDVESDKPTLLYQGSDIIGASSRTIFTSPNNAYWKFVCKATAHAFSKNEVSQMVQIATTSAHKWIKRFDELATVDALFDPSKEMIKLTYDVICSAGFEYKGTDKEHENLMESLEITFCKFGLKQLTNPLCHIFGMWNSEVRKAWEHCRKVQVICACVLQAYCANPNKSQHNTLLCLIAENPHFPGDHERIAEILTVLVAGHDMTGYTLSSTLLLLAKHKPVAEKLRDELKRSPADEWHNVEYMKCVIKESMRFMPVTAILSSRTTGRNFRYHGEMIPKGSTCILPTYLVMHNENVFEKADEFLPERWLNATPAMNDSFLPFAAGNRNCIGQSLAKAQIESVLPIFITQFDFELESEGELDFFLSLKYVGARLKAKRIAG